MNIELATGAALASAVAAGGSVWVAWQSNNTTKSLALRADRIEIRDLEEKLWRTEYLFKERYCLLYGEIEQAIEISDGDLVEHLTHLLDEYGDIETKWEMNRDIGRPEKLTKDMNDDEIVTALVWYRSMDRELLITNERWEDFERRANRAVTKALKAAGLYTILTS